MSGVLMLRLLLNQHREIRKMNSQFTAHQSVVVSKVLAEESAKRAHLVVSLSGAHAYGFPSPDSDFDLKAIHMVPTRELLGLGSEPKPAERLEVIEGVEVDYSSNELQHVLKGVLHGNGNYIERILGHLQLQVDEELQSLKPLVKASLSRNVYRHYSGFARQQLKEWEKTSFKVAKKLLYVVRTTMTGLHVLSTGEVVTDVTMLINDYGLIGISDLIEQKRLGEMSELPEPLAAEWRGRVDGFFQRLDAALEKSPLPSEPAPSVVADLERWLLELRRKRF